MLKKQFISAEYCPAVACLTQFIPQIWTDSWKIVAIKGGWWCFEDREEGEKWEREHIDEVV